MRHLRPLLLGALLGSLSLAPAASAGGPSLFVSTEGRFAATFPERPTPDRAGRETWAGRIEAGSYEAVVGGLHLRIEFHDVPQIGLLLLSEQRILAMAKDSMLEDMEATISREETARLREHPGIAVRFETSSRPGQIEECRLYLVGSRLFVIFVRNDHPGVGDEAAARFLASFNAWEPGETLASASRIGSESGL